MPITQKPQLNRAFWVGAVGAGLVLLVGMFGPHAASAWMMPRVLEEQVQQDLLNAGFYHVDVTMDGQVAVLTGGVDTQAAIAYAERVALIAAGPGGSWSGGVTRVDVTALQVRGAPAGAEAPTG